MKNNASAPATKADLKGLATKTDLKNLESATKADLKNLESATKADLKNLELATKAEMKKLATKDELKAVEQKLTGKIDAVEATVKNIAVELTKTQADVREIKYDMATKMATKDDINRIMSAIDTYTAEAISYRNRDTLRGRAVMDHDAKLKDHGNRLTALETNPPARSKVKT